MGVGKKLSRSFSPWKKQGENPNLQISSHYPGGGGREGTVVLQCTEAPGREVRHREELPCSQSLGPGPGREPMVVMSLSPGHLGADHTPLRRGPGPVTCRDRRPDGFGLCFTPSRRAGWCPRASDYSLQFNIRSAKPPRPLRPAAWGPGTWGRKGVAGVAGWSPGPRPARTQPSCPELPSGGC